MDRWFAIVVPYLKLAALGLWDMQAIMLIVPLYLWMAYGALSMMVIDWNEEEQLAGKIHLKRASVGQMLLALALPIIPVVWLFILVSSAYFTIMSLFKCQGLFKFLEWKPFE